MAKVTINGEVFGFDSSRRPMTEAFAIEEAMKCTYGQWEADFAAGSAKAMCGYIWLVWRRNGRDVPIDDILSGNVEVDVQSLNIEADEADPTGLPPEPSGTTGTATSGPSPKSSESGPGRSASLTSPTSNPSLTTLRSEPAADEPPAANGLTGVLADERVELRAASPDP